MTHLEEIDFNCFFMSTKYLLGDLILSLNPYRQHFYKIKELYVSLSYDDNNRNLNIDCMAGKAGLEHFEQIRILGLNVGAVSITWCTSVNNTKVNRISKFYKCDELMRIPNFYPDKSEAIVYVKKI